MAAKSDSRYRLSFGTKVRLLLRVLALTGIVAAAVGVLLVAPIWGTVSIDVGVSSLEGELGSTAQIGSILLAGGLGIILLALVVEIAAILFGGSKSWLGVHSALQVGLAAAILIGLNLYSFQHYKRWDMTRDGQFTLPPKLVAELRQLKGNTEIVVLQSLKTFSNMTTDHDGFDAAALRKVVEKVKDLVAQFREIGPQFRVTVLEKDELFDRRLEELTKDKPALRDAILAAPENSIFFYANNKVQRLGFNEFYQLDKTASKTQSNLILQPQGIETFTRRVLAIEEKKPKIALCVVHDLLTSRPNDYDYYTHSGLRKSLESNGFEVVDVILKKWEPAVEAAAYSPDEYRLEETREDLDAIKAALRELDEERKDAKETKELFTNVTPALREEFRRRFRRELTEEVRKLQLEALDEEIKRIEERVGEIDKEGKKLQQTLSKLEEDDRVLESRRLSDVKAKLKRMLDECDLLIVPRNTWLNIPERSYIPPRAHVLSDSGDDAISATVLAKQVDVMKSFLKQGKPVLACLGPNNEFPFGRRGPLPPGYDPRTGVLNRPLDGFEKLMMDCGVEFSRQIVLFDEEQKSFTAARTRETFGGGSRVIIPQVEFDAIVPKGMSPNPVGSALKFTSQSIDQPLDIRLRHPRPVYLVPGMERKLPYAAEYLFTSTDGWNEERPFGSVRQVDQSTGIVEPPRYDATRQSDPKKGTRDEERRGPFPIGVALQTRVPIDWYDDKYQSSYVSEGKDYLTPTFGELRGLSSIPGLFGLGDAITPAITALSQKETQQVRLSVIGHGGVFTGKQLSPATEQLLLYNCNWLLGREDKLPNAKLPEWKYPRVALENKDKFYWRWGTFVGLPLLCIWMGLIVLLFRRVR